MKCTTSRFLMLVGAVMLFQCLVLNAQAPMPWGEVDHNLRISLKLDYGSKEVLFFIQNVGDQMEDIPLGTNGRFVPSRLFVTIITRDGRLRDSEVWMKSGIGAAGSGVYPILISLLKGSTYTVVHPMSDFVLRMKESPTQADEFPLTALKPGDSLSAHLRNDVPRCQDGHCQAGIVKCWVGDVTSNTVTVP